jgi:hypothetical protein
MADQSFIALDVAREDPEEIKSYLREYPRLATVTLNDQSTWKTYDQPIITPAYYLIDPRGVIRFSGYGATPEQFKIIERLVGQIRKEM